MIQPERGSLSTKSEALGQEPVQQPTDRSFLLPSHTDEPSSTARLNESQPNESFIVFLTNMDDKMFNSTN